jgi:hypothetical protein
MHFLPLLLLWILPKATLDQHVYKSCNQREKDNPNDEEP